MGKKKEKEGNNLIKKSNSHESLQNTDIIGDLTRHKKTDRPQADHEAAFRILAENSSDIIYRMSLPDGHYEYVSPAARNITGYSPRDFYVRQWFIGDIVHPSFRKYLDDEKARLLHGEVPPFYEFQIIHKSGEPRWLHQRNSVIRDEHGHPVALEGIVTDINERKKAELALKESEEQFRTLTESVPDAIFIFNADRQISYVNPQGALLLNATPELIAGKTVHDLFPKDIADQFIRELERVFEHDNPSIREVSYPASGRIRSFEVRFIPLMSHDGTIETVIGIFRDITVHKQAVEELRESQEKYRLLVEYANEAIAVIQEGRFQYANPKVYEIIGYLENEFLNQPIDRFLHPDDRESVVSRYQKRMRGEDVPPTYSFRILDRSGAVKWLEVRIVRIHWEGKPATLNFFNDITERKKAEEALQESEERYRYLVDLSPDAIAIHCEGRFVFVNPAAVKMMGANRPEDVIGKQAIDFIAPEYRDSVRERIKRAIENGESVPVFEEKLTRLDGTQIDIEVTAINTNYKGKPAIQAIGRDITGRKKAEEALRENEEKFRRISSVISDFTYSCRKSPHGCYAIDWMTGAVESITGFSIDEIKSRTCWIFLVIEEDLPLFEKHVLGLAPGESSVSELRIRHKNGGIVWLHTFAECVTDPKDPSSHRLYGGCRDITKRKKTERALQESEERYRSVIEDQSEFICRFSPDGRLTLVNDAYCRYFGLKKEECIGHLHTVVLPEEDARLMKKHMAAFSQENQVATVEHRIVMPSGEVRWQRWSDRAIFDEEGHVAEYQSVGRDITERILAEEALQDSERRLADIINFLPDATLAIDHNGTVIAWNKALEALTGVSAEEMLGKGDYEYAVPFYGEKRPILVDLVLSPDNEIFRMDYSSIVRDGDTITAETKSARPRGNEVILWVTATPLYNAKGEIFGAIESIRDITERRRAEEALRESKQYLATIMKMLQTGVLVINAETHTIEDVNDAALNIIGAPKKKLIGQICHEFICPAGIGKCPITDLGQSLDNSERILLNAKGEKVPVIKNVIPVMVWGKKHLLETFIDITERKRSEEALKKAHDELEIRVRERTAELQRVNELLNIEIGEHKKDEEQIKASLDEKVVLLREIHHRVKNNLQIVISLLNLQSRYIQEKKILEALRECQNRVKAMSIVHEKLYQSHDVSKIGIAGYIKSLTQNLFQFYGISPGKVALTMDAENMSVDINTAIPLGLIINELTSNALKYAFPAGNTGKISILLRKDDSTINLVFSDNGIGIPADFDWRNPQSLGLRLVTSLVEQLQGEIELMKGEGTIFHMILREKKT